MGKLTKYGFTALCAIIIKQAFDDLLSRNAKVRESAKTFLFTEHCESMFDVLGLDYSILERIDFDNPRSSNLRDYDHQIFSTNLYKTF